MRDPDDIKDENDKIFKENNTISARQQALARIQRLSEQAQSQGIPYDNTPAIYHENIEGQDFELQNPNVGWKLHVHLKDANIRDPLARKIARYLVNERPEVTFKVGKHDDQDGKEMTIYVGDFDSTLELAKQLDSRFGSELLPPGTVTRQHDRQFVGSLWGRFDWAKANKRILQEKYGLKEHEMPVQYGSNGISYTRGQSVLEKTHGVDWLDGEHEIPKAVMEKTGDEMARKVFGAYFTGTEEYSHDKKWWEDHPANPENKNTPTKPTQQSNIPDWLKDHDASQTNLGQEHGYGAETTRKRKGVLSYLTDVADKIFHRKRDSKSY